jgi:hypothetical protein
MKWIEMIKIQAASGQGTKLNDELTTLVQTMQRHSDCQGLTKIGFCQHGVVPECFALHLRWETADFEHQGSKTALSLIQSLQNFGLLYHSVWIEQEEKQL